MALICLAILIWFKTIGGYKPVTLEARSPHGG
jgi:hypothetical protein